MLSEDSSMLAGLRRQESVHLAFRASLILKAVFAAGEIIAGIGTYLITQQFIFKVLERVTREELLEDPRDAIVNYLLDSAERFSTSARNFATLYLLSHGVIKLWLIIGLLRGKRSYYPIAIAIFGMFIVYQVYRFGITHSLWLVLITVVDVLVVGLTWQEYRYLRGSRGESG